MAAIEGSWDAHFGKALDVCCQGVEEACSTLSSHSSGQPQEQLRTAAIHRPELLSPGDSCISHLCSGAPMGWAQAWVCMEAWGCPSPVLLPTLSLTGTIPRETRLSLCFQRTCRTSTTAKWNGGGGMGWKEVLSWCSHFLPPSLPGPPLSLSAPWFPHLKNEASDLWS